MAPFSSIIQRGVFYYCPFLLLWLWCNFPTAIVLVFSLASSSSSSRNSNIWNNKIVTCSSTKELTEAVRTCVQSNHVVAELGAQLRDVSTEICQQCQSAVLVDVQRKFPSNNNNKKEKGGSRTAAMRMPNEDGSSLSFYPEKAEFIEIQSLQNWIHAFFPDKDNHNSTESGVHNYDVLVLDVNAIVGNDLEWTSLSLIQQFQQQVQQQGELIVLVKSVGLHQFASRLVYGKHYRKDYKAIPPPHILATVGVQEYRSTIDHVVRSDDAVLEVGCHFGTTTALLYNKTFNTIGVDVGSKIIAQAQKKYPDIYFAVGDAWKTAALLRIQQEFYSYSKKEEGNNTIGFDVVYVDVGGLSGSDGLLEAILLVSSIRHALEPRCIVIKSLCMQRLSTKLVSFWHVQKKIKEQQQQQQI